MQSHQTTARPWPSLLKDNSIYLTNLINSSTFSWKHWPENPTEILSCERGDSWEHVGCSSQPQRPVGGLTHGFRVGVRIGFRSGFGLGLGVGKGILSVRPYKEKGPSMCVCVCVCNGAEYWAGFYCINRHISLHGPHTTIKPYYVEQR